MSWGSRPGVRHAGHLRVLSPGVLILILSCGLASCADSRVIPDRYVKRAEPGVTLTTLTKKRAAYQGKVVILGGVIVNHKQGDNRVWLRVKNRPLDGDYIPHLPVDKEGPESGLYWVMVWNKDLPKDYRQWARVTIVGEVLSGRTSQDLNAVEEELVLSAIYLRGWGKDFGGYLTEADDHGLLHPPSVPREIQKNAGQ